MVSMERAAGRARARGRRRLVLAVLSVANALVILDGLIVAVALPAIQDDLGFDGAGLQWVVNAYVLCFGGGLLLGGRAADLVGRRRMAVAGLLAFAAGSVVAGLAPTAAVLVAGRALQGAAAAALDPALLALLVGEFPEGRERDWALGIWSAAGSLGIPAGALLGGLLTAAFGWRWVLLAPVPVALAAALLVRLTLDERRDQTTPRRFDLPGAVTATAGLALLIFAITQTELLAGGPGGEAGGPSGPAALPRVAVPLAVAAALLATFVVVERRSPAPLVRLELLRRPGMLPADGCRSPRVGPTCRMSGSRSAARRHRSWRGARPRLPRTVCAVLQAAGLCSARGAAPCCSLVLVAAGALIATGSR